MDDDSSPVGSPVITPTQKSMYTPKNVGDSLSTFNGTNSLDINQWISEFEEMAEFVQWSSLQMFVYA